MLFRTGYSEKFLADCCRIPAGEKSPLILKEIFRPQFGIPGKAEQEVLSQNNDAIKQPSNLLSNVKFFN